MKILLMLFIISYFSLSSSAQSLPTDSLKFTKTDYLIKSKRSKTTGFVLAGIGFATLLTGASIAVNGAAEETSAALTCIFSIGFVCPEVANAQRKQKTGSAIFFVGLGTAIGSIPFFTSASKHKKKANAMSVRIMEPVFVDGIVFKQTHPYSVKIVLAIK